jgi:hypothetical protein
MTIGYTSAKSMEMGSEIQQELHLPRRLAISQVLSTRSLSIEPVHVHRFFYFGSTLSSYTPIVLVSEYLMALMSLRHFNFVERE